MLFTELLKKHGLTEETVSHSVKVKIKRYNKFVAEIEKERLKLADAKTPRAKVVSENEIKKGEEYIASLNDEICKGVENYAANIELNIEKAKNLEKTRAAKAAKKETTATPIVETIVEEKPNTEEKEEEVIVEENVAIVEQTEKKKGNVWGWILGITLVVVTGGAVAYNHFKNKE